MRGAGLYFGFVPLIVFVRPVNRTLYHTLMHAVVGARALGRAPPCRARILTRAPAHRPLRRRAVDPGVSCAARARERRARARFRHGTRARAVPP